MSLRGRKEYIPSPGQAIESGRNPRQIMTSGEEGRKALFGVGSSYFIEGLCIDVLYDRSDTVDDDEQTYLGEINDKCSGEDVNLISLRLAPRNSIIVRDDFGVHIAYPFFPSHLCMPIKPGERVWMIARGDQKEGQFYWMSRVVGLDHTEDANFTFHEHVHNYVLEDEDKDAVSSAIADVENAPEVEKIEDAEKKPQVGAEGPVTPTEDGAIVYQNPSQRAGRGTEDMARGMQDIIKTSRASSAHRMEPVPRYTKRPGDLVMQGSNNTLISLGTDRGWTSEKRPLDAKEKYSNAYFDPDAEDDKPGPNPQTEKKMADEKDKTYQFAGAIDIVVGRGRFPGNEAKEKTPPKHTEPQVINDNFDVPQTDKNPQATGNKTAKQNRLENPTEGDPDFMRDAARIYVAQSTHGDLNFLNQDKPQDDNDNKLKYNKAGDKTAGVKYDPVPATLDKPGQSYVIAKGDNVRIIARRDKEEEINGSIRIIKEGIPDDEGGNGRAVILIEPDGTIVIDGPKIQIGSGNNAKGPAKGHQVVFGNDAKDTVLLADKAIAAIIKAVKAMHKDTMSPTDSLMAPLVLAQWAAAIAGLESDLNAARSEMIKLK